MTTKSSIFSSVISGSPMIIFEKLVGNENYLSRSASVELWFMGQGYEDHLVTQDVDIPEVDRAKGLYTNDIQRLYKVASSIVNVRKQDMDLSTYIGQIAFLKEEFLTRDASSTDVGDQRTQIDKFFMVLTLIGLHPDLETVHDQILGKFFCVSSLKLTLEEDAVVTEVEANVLIAPIAISLATLVIGVTKSASIASVAQTGNASACLTHTSFLGPWILDSGASDHIYGPEYGEDDWHRTTNFLPKPQNASSWDTPDFKRVIVVIPLRLIATFSPPIAFSPTSGLSSPSSCRCSSFFAEVPADSLPLPSASPASLCLLLLTYPLLFRKLATAMVDEMAALHSNGTWDLVVLPSGKSTLVVVGSTQLRLALMVSSVRLLLSMAAMRSWPLYQGVWFSVQVTPFSIWLETISSSMVYVDDIVITGSDQNGIQKLKQHLFTHFQTKDLGKLKYFLGIEIAQSSSGVVLSQRKYALDILEETGMLGCKPVDTPMDPNVKLIPGQGAFRRSWEISATCSHWDAVIRILRYIKSTPGQGVLYENRGHTQVVGYTDADWVGSPTDRCSISGYCVFIGGNLISRKSKKQDVVARSSAEAEYRAMALATCELIWLKHLLRELRFGKDEQMKLICDNQAALHIASNPVFHERTKHIEVDFTSLERRSHQDVWRLVLSIQMIN
ncbi:Retrovirus-related Pol polyprotein from transposon RE1 [Vitis vinifera]|uniref:Retrovirus-related Pol polyprotein from transposon RE1 n=1 Tax=Vitis vinifera TaxID=29760 RepID=A0A438EVD5_VITVI|nr:Retrovirus-related Pol polyprotein from transposon RE1 [Vitis vinifera]